MASSFAIFLIFPIEILEKLFSSIVLTKVKHFNRLFPVPNMTIIALLMLIVGVSYSSFVIEGIYQSSMLYQILYFVSKPLVILVNFLFSITL
jgi:hypothetical protein